MRKKFSIILICLFNYLGFSQESPMSEIIQITEILEHYIEGTANGQPERLKIAFHPNFNLYSVDDKNNLKIMSGADYIKGLKSGQKSNRTGKILSIDIDQNTAMAKLEIDIPNWRVFTDFMLLVKYQDQWKIIHKSYTWKANL